MELAKKVKPRRNGGRKRSNRKASPVFSSLLPELVTEILLRLPARSVGRFRCVSKSFRSLLSDPKFAKNHVDLILRNDVGHRRLILDLNNLFWVDYDRIVGDGREGIRDLTAVELYYPYKEDMDYMARTIRLTGRWCRPFVIGSANGLVCLYMYWRGDILSLYNPTIRESKRIPYLPESLRSVTRLKEIELHGFGFDAVTDDYKVVKFVSSEDKLLTTYVYSLKSDSWRQISDVRYHIISPAYTGVHLNGALHWIAYLGENRNQRVVAAFDINTEEFRDISLPDEAKNCPHPKERLRVGNLKGCLCVAFSCNEMHDDIWVMSEYGVESSWTKIRLSVSYKTMKPVCSTKNDEEVLLVLDKRLVLYNFESNTWRSLEINGINFGRRLEARTYVESLISPDSYGVE